MTLPVVVRAEREEIITEDFDRDKLSSFLQRLNFNLDSKYVNIELLVDKIVNGLPDRISTNEIYGLTSETIASNVINHPDHAILAGRVVAAKLQKEMGLSFSKNVEKIVAMNKEYQSTSKRLFSPDFLSTVQKNRDFLDSLVDHSRDFELAYFGIKTLEKSYLLNIQDQICETPQFLFLRVAIGIHGDDMEAVATTYDLMSKRYFIHASPTLFNSGTNYNFLSSCFLLAMDDDSIDGIYKTLHKAAMISKASGGIGIHVHNIRGEGSRIASSEGTSSGLVPMLRVFNNTARYVDQGGNKRPGAFAIYLEPWHSDIFSVLELKKNHGKEELRARDLFYGLWIPDLFMHRVKENLDWSLFSSNTAPGLSECYGEEFNALYERYEKENRAIKVVKAQRLWHAILESQIETGGPYMLYKDSCNQKSNQRNLGTIKSSNLCCEIIEYSSPEETAVCNLGSLALPSFINAENDLVTFDFVKLHEVTKVLAKNLDKIIDVTRYPIPSAKISNKKHRPIAIGVQGLADLFLELRLPFDSEKAKILNIQIFETIYHAAVEASCELAKNLGPYDSFNGSPMSQGQFQFDMWDHKPSPLFSDWDELKEKVKKTGVRNSLLVAPMPTASTSQILGFNECFEPYTSNIYNRRVLSGEFQVVNKYLLRDLIDLGIWNPSMKNRILAENGSIQSINSIPKNIKDLYKTVWEISQKVVIEMAADRGKFIDQLQSLNIHLSNPTLGKLTSCHFYAWKNGLKTGMYYLRTQAATRAIQFTVDMEEANKADIAQETCFKGLERKRYLEVESISQQIKSEVGRKRHKRYSSVNGDKKREDVTKDDVSGKKTKTYNIYDDSPVACHVNNNFSCDSCSG